MAAETRFRGKGSERVDCAAATWFGSNESASEHPQGSLDEPILTVYELGTR